MKLAKDRIRFSTDFISFIPLEPRDRHLPSLKTQSPNKQTSLFMRPRRNLSPANRAEIRHVIGPLDRNLLASFHLRVKNYVYFFFLFRCVSCKISMLLSSTYFTRRNNSKDILCYAFKLFNVHLVCFTIRPQLYENQITLFTG